MRLKFILNKNQDKKITKKLNFPESSINKIDLFYKNCSFLLNNTQKLYQRSWDEINKEFSDYIEKETGYKWFYPKYECLISIIHPGISNWGESPFIIRHLYENPYLMRKGTAHELIISHYFEIYNRYYNKENLSKGQVWALAEIAAFALTSLNPQIKKWWPWDTHYCMNHNYPQIFELQNKLRKIFENKKDFDDYMQKGINLIKKYPSIGPRKE